MQFSPESGNIGAQLRQYREQQRLTQAQLATASGVALRTLIRLEAGDTAVRLASFERVAAALGVRVGVLAQTQRRPTLDELAALYPDDEAVPAAKPRAARAKARKPS